MLTDTAQVGKWWVQTPDQADFEAARQFLSLLFQPNKAATLARYLEVEGKTVCYVPSMIAYAAGKEVLPRTNKAVSEHLLRVASHHALSPPMLVRGEPLLIVAGWERICASHYLDPLATVPCRIV